MFIHLLVLIHLFTTIIPFIALFDQRIPEYKGKEDIWDFDDPTFKWLVKNTGYPYLYKFHDEIAQQAID